jgi:putative DeoR family transcriptional regulator (stage III sporulation protein D)
MVSKSTIEKDVQRLAEVNPVLLNDVRKVLEGNWNERHIRGGRSTRRKYMSI